MSAIREFFLRVARRLGLAPPPRTYDQMSTKEVFTHIYREGVWAGPEGTEKRYFSGSGSHDPGVVAPYVNAVAAFLRGYETPPTVLDLGCGDFNVGSQIRPMCGSYIACDIVDELIQFNREHFAPAQVDFRVLDLTRDELPPADILFLRQVLQHLSNADIAAVLPQIRSKFKVLVLTEHLPADHQFVANVDKPRGHEVRIRLNSGVVLTAPPFDLQPLSETVLCEVPEMGGRVRTTMYRLT